MLRELRGATYIVLSVEQKDVRRQPFLPYTTSTLQQDASVRLRFKPKRTMSLAQELYEGIELGDGRPPGPHHLHAHRLHAHLRRGAAPP